MDLKRTEESKDRTKALMTAMMEIQPSVLITKEKDAGFIAAAGCKVPKADLIRCKKLVLSGWKPQRLSSTELMNSVKKMPRKMTQIVRAMKTGTKKLGSSPDEHVQAVRMGRSKRITNRRNNKRYQEKPLLVGPPPINDKLRQIGDELKRLMPGAMCKKFEVYEKDGSYFLRVGLYYEQTIPM